MDVFRNAPLPWLDAAAASGSPIHRLGPGNLCIPDPVSARAILANPDGDIREHSDFFGADDAMLVPRPQQLAVARAVAALAGRHARGIPDIALCARLRPRSDWPQAGNRVLLDLMRPILVKPARGAAVHRALDRFVELRILRRHARPRPGLLRLLDRVRLLWALSGAAIRPLADSGDDDLFDVIGTTCPGIDDVTAARLFAGFVMSLVGSLGFTLGWAVWLTLREGRQDADPLHLVQETLRLYPIAWLMERYPARPFDLHGMIVGPDDALTISPYAVHRDPEAWPDPSAFRPDRWAGKVDRSAWMPFGAGAHACPAAGLNVTLTARLLAAILVRRPRIEGGEGPPAIGVALACPRFTLHIDHDI